MEPYYHYQVARGGGGGVDGANLPAVELAEPPLEGSTGGAGRRPVPQMRTGNRTQVETVKLRSDGQSNCFSGCRFRIKSNDIARKAIEKRKEITACGFPSNWIHKSESSNYSTPFLQYGVPFLCVCVCSFFHRQMSLEGLMWQPWTRS